MLLIPIIIETNQNFHKSSLKLPLLFQLPRLKYFSSFLSVFISVSEKRMWLFYFRDDVSEFSYESQLVRYLSERYLRAGRVARPVRNSSQTLKVEFALVLIQILDFDETNQVLTTNVWKRYVSWTPFHFFSPEWIEQPYRDYISIFFSLQVRTYVHRICIDVGGNDALYFALDTFQIFLFTNENIFYKTTFTLS